MTKNEIKELELELELLKELFKFHAQMQGRLGMSEHETENHIDAILDRINEVKSILKLQADE